MSLFSRIFFLFLCFSFLNVQAEKIQILSLDGGGVRGVLSLEILKKLQNQTGIAFHKDFNLFAGTSTGSIIAVSLAIGMPIDEILKDYKEMSSDVFSQRHLFHIFSSKYSQSQLKTAILTILKARGYNENSSLADLPNKVIIPTTRLSDEKTGRWKMDILENITEKGGEVKIIDALLESTAAPLYFPSVKGHVDGGVGMKDPSLAALMQAYDPNKNDLKDCTLFSIGTGYEKHELKEDENWGMAQWFASKEPPLLNMILDVEAQIPAQACTKLLGHAYKRIDLPLAQSFPMDEYEKIDDLITYTHDYITSNDTEWDKVCKWIQEHIDRK